MGLRPKLKFSGYGHEADGACSRTVTNTLHTGWDQKVNPSLFVKEVMLHIK